MQKFFLAGILVLWLSALRAQTSEPGVTQTRGDYLKKARGQQTAGWVLVGTGVVLITTGASIGFSEAMNALGNIFTFQEPENNSNTGEVLFYSGLVVAAGSIPFFISAGKNRKAARLLSVSLKIEDRWQWQGQCKVKQFYPAFSLRVPISK